MTAPGLYLHVPFCSRICPYCDFAVRTARPERRERFVELLLREIELNRGKLLGVDTIYFGGGTPSSLTPDQLGRILQAIDSHLVSVGKTRIFLEANPEDVSGDSLRAWRTLGVGTLSLGVQSFEDAALVFLGRKHDAEQARRSVQLAREAGFQTVSLDLIYGLPGQSPADWRSNLEEAVRLAPDHISCYQLTLHQGTYFGRQKARGRLQEISEDQQAELFDLTHRFLAEAGYPGYEASNFARSADQQSRHNRKYWDHTAYLGLGPSAHSFADNHRWWNFRRLETWEEKLAAGEPPVEAGETLGPGELGLETLMLGFRTYRGVDLRRFRARFGFDLLETSASLIERLQDQRLLCLEDGRLKPTIAGLAIADRLALSFDLAPLAPSPARS